MKTTPPNALARALRRFFAEHLPGVRGASPHTVTSYRDAWALLLRFLAARTERLVVELDLGDLAPGAIVAFLEHLEHLEQERGNSATTRNARLAALHAFARYAATLYPEWLETCQRLLAVPFKRANTSVVEYLEASEIRALIGAIDPRTPTGRRDHALLLTLFNTGARVQELLDLRPVDLQLDRPYQVRLLTRGFAGSRYRQRHRVHERDPGRVLRPPWNRVDPLTPLPQERPGMGGAEERLRGPTARWVRSIRRSGGSPDPGSTF